MSVLDRVKNHISNNRGKYGAVAGAGTAYGLSQINPNDINPLINQAAFNTMAQGQNLALNVADKIGYGKEQLQNLGIDHTISPGAIRLANDIYNSKVGQIINPSAGNMIDSAKLDFGMKDLIGVHENTNIGNKMKIEIKKALLEGQLPEQIITEAKHAGTPYEKGTPLGTLNRPILNNSIRFERSDRDYERSIGAHSDANYSDNRARLKSQMGETSGWNLKLGGPYHQGQQKGIAAGQQPRLYQAAKK